MRRLSLLLAPALFAGCSISLNFDADGTLDFAVGDIGTDCTIDDEPPEGCTVDAGIDAANQCVITAVCTGLEIVDTQEIQEEIDAATNNNPRITTRVEGVELIATGLNLQGFGTLPPNTTATARAVTDAGTLAFDLTQDDYNDLAGGRSVTVLKAPEDGEKWQDDAFLTELNDALDNGDPLPVTATLIVTVPDAAAFQGASGATGALDWTAVVDGRGGVSLRSSN